MEFKIGDLVTRNSYNNDMVFVIIGIEDDNYILKGVNIRLYADSPKEDLKKCENEETVEKEDEFLERVKLDINLNRDDYFYLPGKILHIDGDHDYLSRCLKYYEKANIWAKGILESEENISYRIRELLEEYNPNIIVITGHDAYYRKKGDIKNLDSYKNSANFVKAIKEARKYEKSHEKLIVIAGACQSNYEELIKAGANFASSPKRVNIHALDPAIIATKMSLSDVTKNIDLKGILENTKYGANGMGGVITKGTMHVGYPR
ncbi:MAG: sporulation peptidase YabG [Mollicutes bacterium]|nr:sporulation peptidase YabG [Mollicutes bacterium]